MPNIIFIFAILGILLLILRRLPEATVIESVRPKEVSPELKLQDKGLPAIAVSKLRAFFSLYLGKLWNFLLEAKDLKPTAVAGYRIRKLFGYKGEVQNTLPPQGLVPAPEVKDEKYFLEAIKQQPKNRGHYDALGKYYIGKGNWQDARDVYLYLVKHEPANADFHSRLAKCFYQLGMYAKASQHYRQSLALDSSQPSRYYNLGLSLEGQAQNDQAIEAFREAIALEPKNIKFYLSLSNVYLKTGKTAKAKEALKQAKALDPDNENIKAKMKSLRI